MVNELCTASGSNTWCLLKILMYYFPTIKNTHALFHNYNYWNYARSSLEVSVSLKFVSDFNFAARLLLLLITRMRIFFLTNVRFGRRSILCRGSIRALFQIHSRVCFFYSLCPPFLSRLIYNCVNLNYIYQVMPKRLAKMQTGIMHKRLH